MQIGVSCLPYNTHTRTHTHTHTHTHTQRNARAQRTQRLAKVRSVMLEPKRKADNHNRPYTEHELEQHLRLVTQAFAASKKRKNLTKTTL